MTDLSVLVARLRTGLDKADNLALRALHDGAGYGDDFEADHDPKSVLSTVRVLRQLIDGYEATIERHVLLVNGQGVTTIVCETCHERGCPERAAASEALELLSGIEWLTNGKTQ